MISALHHRLTPMLNHRYSSRVLTALVLAIAAALRFINLGNPKVLVFDETYYVKDAYTLGREGAERDWPDDPNPAFEAGDVNSYLDAGAYVVHPPFGKWLIYFGIQLFGAESSFGWRFATALAGVISVLLIILIAKRLTGSKLFGNIAGLLLAVEGQSIVLSRTAILDGLLTMMVLLGLLILIQADESFLQRANELRMVRLRFQPWLLLLGVVMGLAASIKWSALYVLAGFGLYTFFSDLKARGKLGQNPVGAVLQGVVNALTLLVPAFAAYVFSWLGWILGSSGWGRDARDTWWESLWAYHQNAFAFHTGLSSEHPYQANAFEWLLSLRPTAFYFERFEDDPVCSWLTNCTIAITAIPNLIVWFGGLLALLWLVPRAFAANRAAVLIILGFASAWVPWIIYLERTTFQFYAVLLVPFATLALVVALHHYWRRGIWLRQSRVREKRIILLLVAALVFALYFTSIWMGLPVPYWVWRIQMLLPIWI